MHYDSSRVIINVCILLCKVECVSEKFTAYRWIKFNYIKLDESASAFMFDVGEPFNHCPCVSPLVDISGAPDLLVDGL